MLTLNYEKIMDLRYGENPHQSASVYKETKYTGLSLFDAKKLQGQEISFNNFFDLDATLSIIRNFDEPCCCILKHATPCGIAINNNITKAYKNAYLGDPISPFGGIVGFNREVDKVTAEEIAKIFMSAIIAPSYTTEAKEILAKKKKLIVLQLPMEKELSHRTLRWINGGILLQDSDIEPTDFSKWEVVTQKKPTEEERKAMEFGFKVVQFVKSNAMCITTAQITLGMGCGQPNRVGSLEIAFKNMKDNKLLDKNPKIIASDAFIPFRDSIDLAVKEGIYAIVQPGGSIRDQEVIDACNEHKVTMLLTHTRHFRH